VAILLPVPSDWKAFFSSLWKKIDEISLKNLICGIIDQTMKSVIHLSYPQVIMANS
jgi:hypothetical protein